jgi:hypothetical protein
MSVESVYHAFLKGTTQNSVLFRDLCNTVCEPQFSWTQHSCISLCGVEPVREKLFHISVNRPDLEDTSCSSRILLVCDTECT